MAKKKKAVPKKKRKYTRRAKTNKSQPGQELADAIQGFVRTAIKQELGSTINLLRLATKQNTAGVSQNSEAIDRINDVL